MVDTGKQIQVAHTSSRDDRRSTVLRIKRGALLRQLLRAHAKELTRDLRARHASQASEMRRLLELVGCDPDSCPCSLPCHRQVTSWALADGSIGQGDRARRCCVCETGSRKCCRDAERLSAVEAGEGAERNRLGAKEQEPRPISDLGL